MSISTKTGDKGFTSLFTMQRIKKNSLRVNAYGEIDELNSLIGEARFYIKNQESIDILSKIQSQLYKISAILASLGENFKIDNNYIDFISNIIIKFEKIINLKGFVVLSNTKESAKLDIIRAVTRRAERAILNLFDQEKIDENIIIYLNRLSDLFFILARYEEFIQNKIEYVN